MLLKKFTHFQVDRPSKPHQTSTGAGKGAQNRQRQKALPVYPGSHQDQKNSRNQPYPGALCGGCHCQPYCPPPETGFEINAQQCLYSPGQF